MRTSRRILVTGGCGFIGSHLVKRLLERGERPVVIDRRRPAYPMAGVRYVSADITDSVALAKALKAERYNIVFHLAAESDVNFCEANARRSELTNFFAVKKILEVLAEECGRRRKPIRFIFASSAAVYGIGCNSKRPRPISQYGNHKWMSERAIFALRDEQPRFEAACLRLFNVYGTPATADSQSTSVVVKFREGMQSDRPLKVNGDGAQIRDYIHVADVVDALLCAMNGSLPKEAIDIGTGRGISIMGLTELIGKIQGGPPRLHYAPPKKFEVSSSVANPRRAKQFLQWQPQRPAAEQITDFLAHGRNGSDPGGHDPGFDDSLFQEDGRNLSS